MLALSILLGGLSAPPPADTARARIPVATESALVVRDTLGLRARADSLARLALRDSLARLVRTDSLRVMEAASGSFDRAAAAESLRAAGETPDGAPGAAGSTTAPARDTLARAIAVPPRTPAPLFEYMWVLRAGISSPERVVQVVARARAMGVRGLLAQVVARGDAFYRSALLPRAESLLDTTYDPLADLLVHAHAAGLEVHAWVNCAVVWSGPRPPRDPRHVLNAHPEWVVRAPGGRPMTLLRPDERRRLGLEGIFLSPSHRGVRVWVARIAQEIARNYPVDGIHLDYIRQPGLSLASDPITRAGFVWRTGFDPERFDALGRDRRAQADSAWTAWRGEQVTQIVRDVRDSLERVRPGIPLSAAVLADTVSARRGHAQPWTDWVRTGLIDRAFVMCYAPPVRTVQDQMQGYAAQLGTDGRVVPGIAIYNTPPEQAAAKARAAARLGYPALALYSYDSLIERHGYWESLRRRVRTGAPAPAGGRIRARHARARVERAEDAWTRR